MVEEQADEHISWYRVNDVFFNETRYMELVKSVCEPFGILIESDQANIIDAVNTIGIRSLFYLGVPFWTRWWNKEPLYSGVCHLGSQTVYPGREGLLITHTGPKWHSQMEEVPYKKLSNWACEKHHPGLAPVLKAPIRSRA